MPDDKVSSACSDEKRVALHSALRFASLLVALALFGASPALAQRPERKSARQSASGRDGTGAGSQQTRARRVASTAAAQEGRSEAATVNAPETVKANDASGTRTEPAVSISMEEEPPAPSTEASGRSDRLSALRAQIAGTQDDGERSRLRRTLIDYLVALRRERDAINELRAMMREERFDPAGFYNIGNWLARLGDTDTAIDAYRKAIEQRRGHYSRALNNLGVVLLRQGRWDEALEALTSALRQEAYHYPEASYNLGRLYSMRGEAALAIREWSRVLALQPDHVDAALALSRAYAEDGNPQRAISVIDAFTSRRGPNSELAAARREILSAMNEDGTSAPGRTNTATGNSSSAVAASSGTASGPRAKADEEGARLASSSLRSMTVDRETYNLLERARASREAGESEDAVGFYNRVLSRRGGFFPPANLELSFVLSELKRHEEAAATLKQLIARAGARYPIAYFHLGREYEALNQLDLAAESYARAAAAYGEAEPQFLLDVSRVREKEGKLGAALEAMQEYARLTGRRGRTPEWTADRLAQLKQKMEAAAPAQNTTPKP